MQCSVTKDKLRKMLTTNPQGIASFFKTINEQDFYTPLNKQRSAAEQLEHLRLAYKTGTDLVKDSEALNQNAKGSYRMYSVIAKLFQASLNHSKRQIKKPELTESSSQSFLIKTYLQETKLFAKTALHYSEVDLDHKTVEQSQLGHLSIREYIFFLMHHDKHHVMQLQAALK